MKVVLLQDVAGLGSPGAIKDVKDGYARNYLLPRKLATPATAGAVKQVEQRQQVELRRQEKVEREAAAVAGRIQGQEITFRVRAGEEGRLYGSVTNGDVADVLARKLGIEVDRRKVQMDEPIHTLGTFEIPVRLSASHAPVVKVTVEAE